MIFLKWLSSKKMTCYRIPTVEQLRGLSENQSRQKASLMKTAKNGTKDGRDIPMIRAANLTKLELDTVNIHPLTLWAAPYGEELEWVVDFAFTSLISFTITEIIFHFPSPSTKNEYNFSLLWVSLVIIQSTGLLLELTSNYFYNKDSVGERSICIVSSFVFFFTAMLILSLEETSLETGISKATESLCRSLYRDETSSYCYDSSPYMISFSLKLLLAFTSSIVGAIFIFPGFRFGQLQEALVEQSQSQTKIIYLFNHLASVLVIILWIPKISRIPLNDMTSVEIDDRKFDLLRVGFAMIISLVRAILVPYYTKEFLKSGKIRVDKIRQRGGFTTSSEIQMTVAGINNYVNIVAIQYLLPTLICLFTAIMYLTLSLNPSQEPEAPGSHLSGLDYLFGEQLYMVEDITSRVKRIFVSDFFKNLLCYATWWSHFTLFSTTSAGVIYHKYFTN